MIAERTPLSTRFAAVLTALAGGLAIAGSAAAQDAGAGAGVFQIFCSACHSVERSGPKKAGPTLAGVVGRRAGSVAGFNYSAAMKAYGQTWTPANLEVYLTAPTKTVPGTNMTFAGVKDATKRANLIAYLKQQK